jgi:hypothetical protein
VFANERNKEKRSLENEVKKKAKEYKKEGFEVAQSSKTLEQALFEHYQKKDQGQFEEYESRVIAKTVSLCQQKCLNEAQNFIARTLVSKLKFRFLSAYGSDGAAEELKDDVDRFFGALENIGEININGVLTPGFSLLKKMAQSKYEYRMFFLYNKDLISSNSELLKKVMNKMLNSYDNELEFSKKMHEFIENGFK